MSDQGFRRLQLHDWRQFGDVLIEFDPRLTVLTGANGAGKSTLLSLLSRHFGWHRDFLAVPRRSKTGTLSYLNGWIARVLGAQREAPPQTSIGHLEYANGVRTDIMLTNSGSFQVNVNLPQMQGVQGIFIDSHRPTPRYQTIAQIPLSPMTAEHSFNTYNQEMLTAYGGGHGAGPLFRMKESIISMGIFGEGNSTLGGGNPELKATFEGFNTVLEKLLPESLGFQRILIRSPEVVLITNSGDFMLDSASGGIMAIIDVAWRVYMFSKNHETFVVAMDEPENHLHPSMQRSLLKRLIDTFPAGQFIIATHSPFMVTSVKDSAVYALRYEANKDNPAIKAGLAPPRSVYSQRLALGSKIGTANDTLREVLGVPATMPEWVEQELDQTLERYRNAPLDADAFDQMRRDLSAAGFEEFYIDAVQRVTAGR